MLAGSLPDGCDGIVDFAPETQVAPRDCNGWPANACTGDPGADCVKYVPNCGAPSDPTGFSYEVLCYPLPGSGILPGYDGCIDFLPDRYYEAECTNGGTVKIPFWQWYVWLSTPEPCDDPGCENYPNGCLDFASSGPLTQVATYTYRTYNRHLTLCLCDIAPGCNLCVQPQFKYAESDDEIWCDCFNCYVDAEVREGCPL